MKEHGEGVDRIYNEMQSAGLPAPEYRVIDFMVYATLKNHKFMLSDSKAKVTPPKMKSKVNSLNFVLYLVTEKK